MPTIAGRLGCFPRTLQNRRRRRRIALLEEYVAEALEDCLPREGVVQSLGQRRGRLQGRSRLISPSQRFQNTSQIDLDLGLPSAITQRAAQRQGFEERCRSFLWVAILRPEHRQIGQRRGFRTAVAGRAGRLQQSGGGRRRLLGVVQVVTPPPRRPLPGRCLMPE